MKQCTIILLILITTITGYSKPQEIKDLILVYPELTKNVLYSNDSSFRPTDSWELFFLRNNIKYRMLDDDALDELNGNAIIILPDMTVITNKIIEHLEGLLKNGSGVLITGNFAEFDEDGNRLKSDFIQNILDFQISRLPETASLSIDHILKGNTPFSVDLNPGTKILLKSKPGLYYASNVSGNSSLEGYYLPVDQNSSDSLAGIVSETRYSGRLLWYGFNFDQFIGTEINTLLFNSLNWLSSKPVIFINYLPGRYSSAGIIYKVINNKRELNYPNVPGIKNQINYFAVPGVFENSNDQIKNLDIDSDLNIAWDDFYFSHLPFSEVLEWLEKTGTLIKTITGQTALGIYSVNGVSESSLLKVLNKSGYSFIFYPGYSNSFAVSLDSINNIYSFIQTSVPGEDYRSSIDFIVKNNGIFYLNADSIESQPNQNHLKNDSIWYTSYSDLLGWILKKDRLKISADIIDNNYKIKIINSDEVDITNIGIWISDPGRALNFETGSTGEDVKLIFDHEKKMYFMNIDLIKSKEHKLYSLAIKNGNI